MAIRLPKLRHPSWREAFLALLSFTFVSAVVWGVLFYRATREEARFVEGWADLFEFCRFTIENGQPVFAPSYTLLGAETSGGGYSRVQYGKKGERFAATLVTEPGVDGLLRRSCSVGEQNWRRPMTESERGLLMLAFLYLRNSFVASGTHEVRSTDFVMDGRVLIFADSISFAFGPVDLNGAGCEVTAVGTDLREGATFINEGPYVSVLVYEEPREGAGIPCGTPPPAPAATSATDS